MQSLFAQIPTLEWVSQSGGLSFDYVGGMDSDSEGNVYSAGFFQGTVDFDTSDGVLDLTSSGDHDVYVQKLDDNGDFVWAKRIGSSGEDRAYAIAVDIMGNVYITGYFEGIVDFNPGIEMANLSSVGNKDVFILKLDTYGDFVWAKQFGGSSVDYSASIAIDIEGNVYTTGYFYHVVDFDPGEGTYNLTSVGERDIFVAKLDTNGNFVWAKSVGGVGYDQGNSIGVDDAGNVYTTGWFNGIVDFDSGIDEENLESAGNTDVFVYKLDISGNFVWVKQIGDSGGEYGHAIAVSANGDVHTIGDFAGTVDFDPGLGTTEFTSQQSQDVFIQKLDSNGLFIWAKQVGGNSTERGYSIDLDIFGNVYSTGYFWETGDFNPGLGESNLTSAGDSDVFILKLDSNGVFAWVAQVGGSANISGDKGCSVSVDLFGNVITAGTFYEVMDCDPGTDIFTLNSFGEKDIFILKLRQCEPSSITPNNASLPELTSECSLNPPAPMASNGCSNIIGVPDIDFPVTALGSTSITWTYDDGISALVTQTQYIEITPDISVPVPDMATLSVVSILCEITALNAPAPTATDNCAGAITASANLIFPLTDQSITEIVWTYDDGNGNVVTQIQSINWEEIDVSTSVDGVIIIANNANGAYQWIDCDNNNIPLDGEDNQSFTATSNGNYAVEITEDGCTAISECVSIMTVGVNDVELEVRVHVYPNPSSEIFNLEFDNVIEGAVLTVTDINGRLISTSQIQNAAKASVEINEAPGIYLLTIKMKVGQKTIQLIKE